MTTTFVQTIQQALERCTPGIIADLVRALRLDKSMSKVKAVATGLTAAASFNITTAAVKSASVITGVTLDSDETLPAIGQIVSLRVTASGTANSVGTYAIGDSSATPVSPTAGANVGLATLSDDGKTITFPTTVTAFVISYFPRPTDTQTAFGSDL